VPILTHTERNALYYSAKDMQTECRKVAESVFKLEDMARDGRVLHSRTRNERAWKDGQEALHNAILELNAAALVYEAIAEAVKFPKPTESKFRLAKVEEKEVEEEDVACEP